MSVILIPQYVSVTYLFLDRDIEIVSFVKNQHYCYIHSIKISIKVHQNSENEKIYIINLC